MSFLTNIKSKLKGEVPEPGEASSAGRPVVRIKAKKSKKRIVVIGIIILILILAIILYLKYRSDRAAALSDSSAVTTAVVMRGDVSNELTSSGTLQPKDTYTITSLVSGQILEADFEEGDHVTADQVLYVIDSSDASSSVDQALRNLETARESYESALSDYDSAIANLGSGTVKSGTSGYVKNISVRDSDVLNSGYVSVADLYNDSSMYIRLAFLSLDADALRIGQDIVVELSDTGETIPGRVEEKSDLVESINSGTMVKYVKIIVTNPGGLSTEDRGIAYIDGIYSVTDAYFEPYLDTTLRVELPSSVRIDKVLISEGQYVSPGTALFTLTAESYNDALTQAENSLKNAENSLKNAQESLDNVYEQLDNYTLTSPISGEVITKNYKVGDKINSGTSNSTSLALIYDLSELTFEMSIDELDILNVEVGQEVIITADAFEGVSFLGHVSNVSLSSTYSGGVTTYPVVVTLDETGDLLPGMNVDGVLILEESLDTLYIPSGALIRGNIVYVLDESEDRDEAAAADVPEGFRAVQVETGLISDDYVEIISGLSEGDIVYTRDTSSSTTMFGGMGGMGGGGMPGGGGGGMPGGGGGGGAPGGGGGMR